MTVYLLLAIIAGLGLIVIILAQRRSPTADEVLGQPASTRPLAQGANSNLRQLIELNVLSRSTGILTARSGDQTCSVAFLFGHVFHAWCGSVEGEDAIRTALAWTNPLLSFDSKAQLPAEETITRPIESILKAA